MDRLPALAAAALALAIFACDKDSPAPTPSRVEGAKVRENKGANAAGFCDVHAADDSGPAPPLPPLAGPPLAQQVPGHWRWLNVWATWCKPCVEEVPRLTRWRSRLAAAGHPVDLAFVSVDDSSDDVADFHKLHPEMPDSPRLADPSKQGAFFAALGLDTTSPIPIHVFVSPSGHVRCARAGAVSEQDYPAIERLLGE
jgi:thiol-disulfide isomerase/thioredoxin